MDEDADVIDIRLHHLYIIHDLVHKDISLDFTVQFGKNDEHGRRIKNICEKILYDPRTRCRVVKGIGAFCEGCPTGHQDYFGETYNRIVNPSCLSFDHDEWNRFPGIELDRIYSSREFVRVLREIKL